MTKRTSIFYNRSREEILYTNIKNHLCNRLNREFILTYHDLQCTCTDSPCAYVRPLCVHGHSPDGTHLPFHREVPLGQWQPSIQSSLHTEVVPSALHIDTHDGPHSIHTLFVAHVFPERGRYVVVNLVWRFFRKSFMPILSELEQVFCSRLEISQCQHGILSPLNLRGNYFLGIKLKGGLLKSVIFREDLVIRGDLLI